MTNSRSGGWQENSSLYNLATRSRMKGLEVTAAHCGRKALNLPPTGGRWSLWLGGLLRWVKQDTPSTFALVPGPMFFGPVVLISRTLLPALAIHFFSGCQFFLVLWKCLFFYWPYIPVPPENLGQKDDPLLREAHIGAI